MHLEPHLKLACRKVLLNGFTSQHGAGRDASLKAFQGLRTGFLPLL